MITNMQKKKARPKKPTHNRSEPHAEDANVNIVLRNGMMIGGDKGKKLEESEWVHKAPGKEVGSNLERATETFMEEKKSLTEAYTSRIQDNLSEKLTPPSLPPFWRLV